MAIHLDCLVPEVNKTGFISAPVRHKRSGRFGTVPKRQQLAVGHSYRVRDTVCALCGHFGP